MTTKTRNTKSAHAHHNDNATSETNEEVTMSTKSQDTTSTVHAAPVAAPAAPPPAPTGFVPPPPATANIPPVPENFTPAEPGQFRITGPRTAELVSLPQAIADLKGFTDYAQVIGGSAPTRDEVINAFELASQWSTMRASASRWDALCVVQEGLSWQSLRGVAGRLTPAYLLSVTADPTLVSKYTGLTSLLNAKKVSAKKAAYTRRLNGLDKAQGKPPSHGKAGKSAERKAQKAALAAQRAAAQGAVAATPVTVVAAPVVAATPVVDATPAAKPATVTPVTAPGATVANGATPS